MADYANLGDRPPISLIGIEELVEWSKQPNAYKPEPHGSVTAEPRTS